MLRCPRCQRRLPSTGECPAHGRPTSIGEAVELEADTAPSGLAPPGWTLGPHLASGGTARVYAVHREGSIPAVLKLGRWRARDIHARFAAEADTLRTVGPPSTPAYLEHGAVDDWPYLVMERIEGETLAAWMARAGDGASLVEILSLLVRFAGALSRLHAAGYVHRDLKPENVVDSSPEMRLLDLGFAKPLGGEVPDLTQVGSVIGTVHYTPPEQIRIGGIVDQRADLYSFGVIAFEMLAGFPPFVGERSAIEYQHQVCKPPSLRETRDLPSELDELVLACLAKQPDARPRSADSVRAALTRVAEAITTLAGVGVSPAPRPLGRQTEVALVWMTGCDPVEVTRVLGAVRGSIVRQEGQGLLAAFSALDHEAPAAAALAACRDLARPPCSMVLHATSALVRRSAQGKSTFYGPELQDIHTWIPHETFSGLVVTARAAPLARSQVAPCELAGFYRERAHVYSDAVDVGAPPLVGRSAIVRDVVAAVGHLPMLVGISGEPGSGKSRVVEAVVDQLRAAGRELVVVRARRRLDGDRPDDDRVLGAIGDSHDAFDALAGAGARGAVIVIDDAQRLSTGFVHELLRPDLPCARILTSTEPLFDVPAGASARLAIALPPLALADAGLLLRDRLQPARLIPEVLIERLALRGTGNPALLIALALDMKRRGSIRRHAGSDEWYVAPDELDTLLAAPDVAWFAARALEDLPRELAQVARPATALGPRFTADEIAAVTGVSDAESRLGRLVRHGMLAERSGWYELVDATLQDAIYDHLLDERELIHARAFRYWIERRGANLVGWLARLGHHGARSGETATAAVCWLALARERLRHGELDHADRLLARVFTSIVGEVDPLVTEAARLIEPS